MTIIKFPTKEKREKPLPKQRVFYIGFRYVGPYLCQDVQNIYLKRNGLKNRVRTWSLITYGKYGANDYKDYSIELDSCVENDLPNLLDEFEVGEEVTFDELREMGWRGYTDFSATIIEISKKNKRSSFNQYESNLCEEE